MKSNGYDPIYIYIYIYLSGNGDFTDRLMFAATHKTHSQTSAKLLSGWLSKVLAGNNNWVKNVLIRDEVLRFFDNCKECDEATSNLREITFFEQGPYFQSVINNAVNGLKLNGTYNVDFPR